MIVFNICRKFDVRLNFKISKLGYYEVHRQCKNSIYVGAKIGKDCVS